MSSSLRNLRIFPLIILISYLQPCRGAPAPFLNALPSLQTVQTAMERAANYGYQMLGYDHHEDDHVIVKDKPTFWDGHIEVPDFVSPLIAAMPDSYGNTEKVVKGHDGRLGFRLAVPYLGDIQYIREYGPGRFTDKLGPGHYKYPGPNDRPKKETPDYYGHHEPDHYGHHEPDHYGNHEPDHYGYHEPKPSDIIHPKRMYPWNVVNA